MRNVGEEFIIIGVRIKTSIFNSKTMRPHYQSSTALKFKKLTYQREKLTRAITITKVQAVYIMVVGK